MTGLGGFSDLHLRNQSRSLWINWYIIVEIFVYYNQPTKSTNEFKPQPGPNFLLAQVGYRNRVLTSHILQIGCEKKPYTRSAAYGDGDLRPDYLHQGILLEIPAALSLNPYLFRAKKCTQRKSLPFFGGCDQASFLCTSGTCVAGDKKDTQDLNKKQQHKTHEITMAQDHLKQP